MSLSRAAVPFRKPYPIRLDIGSRTTPRLDGAACRGEDPAIFYPTGRGEPLTRAIQAAKTICGGCPVREACLRAAIDHGEQYGIWGGLTPAERRQHTHRQEVAS